MIKKWKKITNVVLKTKPKVNIGLIGKYVNLKDGNMSKQPKKYKKL